MEAAWISLQLLRTVAGGGKDNAAAGLFTGSPSSPVSAEGWEKSMMPIGGKRNSPPESEDPGKLHMPGAGEGSKPGDDLDIRLLGDHVCEYPTHFSAAAGDSDIGHGIHPFFCAGSSGSGPIFSMAAERPGLCGVLHFTQRRPQGGLRSMPMRFRAVFTGMGFTSQNRASMSSIYRICMAAAF